MVFMGNGVYKIKNWEQDTRDDQRDRRKAVLHQVKFIKQSKRQRKC